jgi:plasmid stabilization system protein ParE
VQKRLAALFIMKPKAPALARRLRKLVEDAFRQIEQHPRRFAKLETIPFEGEIRRFLLRKFPYLVIYEIHPDLVEVLAVAHASRMPDYWVDRRK